jgi:alpha-ribazole phosphatase
MNTVAALAVWRHPRPIGVQGRCIGRTDVGVGRRKAKRLAHRIRRWARQQGAARVVFTSSLQRAASVGHFLAGWGWQHHIDARLNEMNFGDWDGLPWDSIGAEAVGAWCQAFAEHAPGGGESVSQLLSRCGALLAELHATASPPCVVGHAGWISAAQWLLGRVSRPPGAAEWPGAISYSTRVLLAHSGP